jgi:hypothetical protein
MFAIALATPTASAAPTSTVYYACLHTGVLSAVSTNPHHCQRGSTAISWDAVGPAGATNYELAQQNGYTGTLAQWLATLIGPRGAVGPLGLTGPPGPTGLAGKTNYQLAVEDGFTGTLSQWLASLVGAQGVPGPTGAVGPIGPPGATGAQGNAGPPGPTGAPGPPGPQGNTGATGAQGPTGGLSDVWVISGTGGFGCFSSCNFEETIASGKSLAAGTYLIAINLDVVEGGTFTPANTQGGVTCFIGSSGQGPPSALIYLPATGGLMQGGSAHVSLDTTLTLSGTTTVGVFCPDTFTLNTLNASTSMTATPVTNVH